MSVFTVVTETERAKSPFAIMVRAFDVVPVGAHPRIIIPTARALPVGPGISIMKTR